MYTALSPYKIQPFNGQPSTDGAITGIDDTVISQRAQDRDWPSLDIDSKVMSTSPGKMSMMNLKNSLISHKFTIR